MFDFMSCFNVWFWHVLNLILYQIFISGFDDWFYVMFLYLIFVTFWDTPRYGQIPGNRLCHSQLFTNLISVFDVYTKLETVSVLELNFMSSFLSDFGICILIYILYLLYLRFWNIMETKIPILNTFTSYTFSQYF